MQNQMSPIVRACAFVGVVLLLTPGHASAYAGGTTFAASEGTAEGVHHRRPGTGRSTGRITTIAGDTLTLTPDRAPDVVVPYAQIVRIDRPHDTLANGALIGFGVGAALGFGLMAAEDLESCEPDFEFFEQPSGPTAVGYVASTLVGGALGTAVGVAFDAIIRRDRGILPPRGRAQLGLAPVLARGRRGAVLAMSW